MISPSSFSLVAKELRTILVTGIEEVGESNITISNPKDRLTSEKNGINLFFYKADYGGFPSDGNTENPLFVRLYCLITAYGADTTDENNGGNSISHGENDLRLIGGVMRVLHHNPVFQVKEKDNGETIQLQAVIQQLNLDDINHIWSTQGDVPYRISVAYEFALVPVPLSEITETSQLVGEADVGIIPKTDIPELPDNGFGLVANSPLVEKTVIDVSRPDWEPHVCFVHDKDAVNYFVALPHSSGADKRNLKIIVAGKQESTVKIRWELWQPRDSKSKQGGWGKPVADEVSSEFTLPKDKNSFKANVMDPKKINDYKKVEVKLPIDLPVTNGSEEDIQKKARQQAIIYVVQEWTKKQSRGKEQKISTRSNPLLVSTYYKKGGE